MRIESEEQKKIMPDINMLFNTRNRVIKTFNDYSSIMFEARNRPVKGQKIKIFHSQKMLQKLPIAQQH